MEKMVRAVTEVSRVVGREGRLAQRASVPDTAGGWATMIDSVNTLIDDLVRPTTEMARVIGAVAKGDLSQTMALEVDGHPLKGQFLRAAATANTMVDQLSSFSSEVTRVAREVGTEGKLGGQAQVKGVAGTWKDLTDSVNSMAGNLTGQVRNIADVTTAVANGDLSKKITVDVKGEILEHRRPCCSTWTCPTATASQCSSVSSATPARATSRCTRFQASACVNARCAWARFPT